MGKEWTPQQMRKFKRTMAKKKKAQETYMTARSVDVDTLIDKQAAQELRDEIKFLKEENIRLSKANEFLKQPKFEYEETVYNPKGPVVEETKYPNPFPPSPLQFDVQDVRKEWNGFDPVKKPKHYNSHPSGIECRFVIEHMVYNIGAAVKYLWRYQDKANPIQDLRKSIEYIQFEIERLERETVGNRKV